MSHIRRLFDHMYWADDRLIALLKDLRVSSEAEGEIGRLFAHLLAAEQIWLLRATGGDASAVPVWPDRALSETVDAAREVREGYQRLLDSATAEDLREVIEYRNSKGISFETELGDILLHVALHGAYHRGQIAAAVRRGGGEPVNTDFITFQREGG